MTIRLGLTLLHFLWQGAAIAAIYAIARLRIRSTQARYALACLALAAMTVVPVITFALSGRTETPQAKPVHVTAAAHHSAPLAKDPALDPIPAVQTHSITNEIVPIWLTGATVLWLRLLFTWIVATRMKSRQTRQAPREWQQTLDRLSKHSVQLLISPLVQVPTVIGWLRPVVLFPVGALAGVPSEHIEALLAHELAHIRRHDYLINILQSIAEATLFYHPAVWWISRNIRTERENCCDDIAVALTGDPLAYAQALTDLESHRPAHLTPALAASGGSLKQRIARLLGVTSHTNAGSGAIAAALILLAAALVFAQTSQPTARFEAASIKLNASNDDHHVEFATAPGRLIVVRNPITNLIGNAYGIHGDNLIGGPEWIRSDRYDVEATASGSPDEKQIMQMLQVLLAERFGLKVHTEQRDQPIYNLVVAQGGLKIQKRTNQNCERKDWTQPDNAPSNPCGNNVTLPKGDHTVWIVTNNDMQHMINALAGVSGRPVVDKTGVTGTFEFTTEFTGMRPGAESNDPNVPSLFGALDQLGLKLEPAKGPVDVLVIDHIDRPTPN